MILIVIELHGASASGLFSDDALSNLRYLAAQGCTGDLADEAVWPRLAAHAGRCLLLDGAGETPQDALGSLRRAVEAGAHDYIHLVLAADTSPDLQDFDAALGSALESLSEDDILAVIAAGPEHSSFLIVARNAPAGKQLGSAGAEDVAATLLALAGRSRPAEVSGRLLIADDAAPPDDDDEAALRERFRGLGYIA